MKKKLLTLFLAAAMLLSVAGCNENNNPSNNGDNSGDNSGSNSGDASQSGDNQTPSDNTVELKDDGDKLTIVTWESNSDVTNMVNIFCENTGTDPSKVEIVRQGKDGGAGSTQIQKYLDGDGDADIITLEADWILKYINDDNLTAPLSAIGIEKSSFASPYQYTVDIGTNEAGVLKGASFQAAPGGFLYRADLAEQYLGVKNPEEMQEKVKDWDTFKATAKELYEASEGKCSLACTEGGLWQVFAANRSKAWVVDGKLVMDNAEEFYDIAKEFSDNHYITGITQWDTSWGATIQDGTALGDFAPTWGLTTGEGSILSMFSGEEGQSASYGNMALCQGPSAYFWGGTWLAVSNKCDNKTLAKQFIEYFTCSDEGMKAYATETGDFCNNSKVMQEIVDAGTNKNAKLKDGQDQFQIFMDQAAGINMTGLITKYDATIKTSFNDSVNAYLGNPPKDADGNVTMELEGSTKEDAIKAFKKAVAAAFPDITVE